MRTRRLAIVFAFLSAILVAGCDSGGEVTTNEFKKTDTAPFKDMQDQMIKNVKGDKSGKTPGKG